jgi:hypothetical protein
VQQTFNAVLDWIKGKPFIVLAGALTTLFGLIMSTSNVIPVVLKALNRPDCLTYASVYRDPFSEFRQEGAFWREYPLAGGPANYEFKEAHRTRDNIDLLNLTPRPDVREWQTLLVRLPVCGGTATLTVGTTEHWVDLYPIWRQ